MLDILGNDKDAMFSISANDTIKRKWGMEMERIRYIIVLLTENSKTDNEDEICVCVFVVVVVNPCCC